MKTALGKRIDTTRIRKNRYGNYRHVRRRTAARYTRRHGGNIYLFNTFWNYLADKHGQPISFVSL